MNLPYDPPDSLDWLPALEAASSRDEVAQVYAERERRRAEAILAALVADAAGIPGYRAVLMETGGAHGYSFQTAVVQLEDSTFLAQSWGGVSRSSTELLPIEFGLDLAGELARLRADGIRLRSRDNPNVDLRSGMEGRLATLYLAVGQDAEWVAFPGPLLGGRYPNTAANRLARALMGRPAEVELVEAGRPTGWA